MFQLLKNPQFDFMKRGQVLLSVSLVLVLASVGVLLVRGLNLGIEFTGGTELQLKYAAAPDVGAIRSTLQDAGLTSQSVTTIGKPEEHEIYIRLAAADEEGAGELTGIVTRTLRASGEQPGRTDLNIADQSTITDLLLSAPGLSAGQAADLGAAISDRRKDIAIYHSLEELQEIPAVTPALLEFLGQQAYVGPLAVRSQSYIGPAIGQELMDKAQWAIVLSLITMLIYIWIRFQLQWGLAAVLALGHDTLVTLGLFSLFNKEMSLPVVAAFLTLVGYSVNDTVVVFDRIRENLRNRSVSGFAATINLSINQTLGRTIITSCLTWIVVFGLYLYGGPALNAFAFVLSVGVVVGTYSSIYIASPLLLLGRRWLTRGVAAGTRRPLEPTARRAKKVRP